MQDFQDLQDFQYGSAERYMAVFRQAQEPEDGIFSG